MAAVELKRTHAGAKRRNPGPGDMLPAAYWPSSKRHPEYKSRHTGMITPLKEKEEEKTLPPPVAQGQRLIINMIKPFAPPPPAPCPLQCNMASTLLFKVASFFDVQDTIFFTRCVSKSLAKMFNQPTDFTRVAIMKRNSERRKRLQRLAGNAEGYAIQPCDMSKQEAFEAMNKLGICVDTAYALLSGDCVLSNRDAMWLRTTVARRTQPPPPPAEDGEVKKTATKPLSVFERDLWKPKAIALHDEYHRRSLLCGTWSGREDFRVIRNLNAWLVAGDQHADMPRLNPDGPAPKRSWFHMPLLLCPDNMAAIDNGLLCWEDIVRTITGLICPTCYIGGVVGKKEPRNHNKDPMYLIDVKDSQRKKCGSCHKTLCHNCNDCTTDDDFCKQHKDAPMYCLKCVAGRAKCEECGNRQCAAPRCTKMDFLQPPCDECPEPLRRASGNWYDAIAPLRVHLRRAS